MKWAWFCFTVCLAWTVLNQKSSQKRLLKLLDPKHGLVILVAMTDLILARGGSPVPCSSGSLKCSCSASSLSSIYTTVLWPDTILTAGQMEGAVRKCLKKFGGTWQDEQDKVHCKAIR